MLKWNQFKPETLRTRLILLMLLTLVLVQLVSVLVYLKDRNQLISSASANLQVQRIVALIRLIDQSERYQYEAILKATETPSLAVLISPDALVPPDQATGDAAYMRKKLYDKTQRRSEQSIRVTYERYRLPEEFDCDTGSYKSPDKSGYYFLGSNHTYWLKEGDPINHDKGKDYGHDSADENAPSFQRFIHSDRRPYELSIAVRLPDNLWLNIRAGRYDEIPVWDWRSAAMLVLIGFVVVGIMLWLLRSNTRPLQKLASAANAIGRGQDTEPLAEEGAQEVRSTIKAFNNMQERQQRFIKDRMLMLAAVSHDLRTPITKLRLQSEFVCDDDIQQKMRHTLMDMEQMLNAAMNFAKDDVQNEASRPTDMASLVQSLCDDLTDQGARLTSCLPDRLVCECRPSAFRRMVSNVLENAFKYADSARVTLKQEAPDSTGTSWIVLNVADDGPGIDETLFEQVFTPFYRVESSRNRSTGGMGLGLSVVRSIALHHGGQVFLSNRKEGGLSVTIRIPC